MEFREALEEYGEVYVVENIKWKTLSIDVLLRLCREYPNYMRIQQAIRNGICDRLNDLRDQVERIHSIGEELGALNKELIADQNRRNSENARLNIRIHDLKEMNEELHQQIEEKDKEIAKLKTELATLKEVKTYMTSDITPTYEFDLTTSPKEFIDACYSTDRHREKDEDPLLYEDIIPIYDEQDHKINVRIIRKFL